MTNITNYTALNGLNFSKDNGQKIVQKEDGGTISTTVYDKDNKLIYEEKDTKVSDSSTMYFYDDNGKLASTTETWYETGFEYGRNEWHSRSYDVTTTIYDSDGKPVKGTHQMLYNGTQKTTDINYVHEDNGDYTQYNDFNRNGKIDDNEHPYYYDKDGNYMSEEDFAAKHPPKNDGQQPEVGSQPEQSWWDKAVNWFKGLFN